MDKDEIKILHYFSPETIDLFNRLGNVYVWTEHEYYFQLPQWFYKDEKNVFEVPFSKLPKEVQQFHLSVNCKETSIDFFNWVYTEFLTDESRLPISGNRNLGGMTIYINHEEYPFDHVYSIYLQSKSITHG
jgi:hypothetical protein